MRKTSAYARKQSRHQADPSVIYRVMSKIQKFTQDEQVTLKLPVREAFERIKTGVSVEGDFHTLAAAVNVTMVRAESIDPLAEEVAIKAKDALMRTLRRHQSTGRWGFDGPALGEISDCIDMHEQLIELQTPLQMQKAMTEVIRRMDAGEIEK